MKALATTLDQLCVTTTLTPAQDTVVLWLDTSPPDTWWWDNKNNKENLQPPNGKLNEKWWLLPRIPARSLRPRRWRAEEAQSQGQPPPTTQDSVVKPSLPVWHTPLKCQHNDVQQVHEGVRKVEGRRRAQKAAWQGLWDDCLYVYPFVF